MARIAFPPLPARLRPFAPQAGRPLRQGAYGSDLRDERVAAILGISLGVTFTICFVTGCISHIHQNPQPWITLPARPAGFYRITQSLHIATGIASIPILLSKLWTVWPRVVQWPPFTSVASVIERVALVPLVGGGLFMLFTGTANLVQWYPWAFGFRAAHFWVSWVTMGALLAHIGAKFTLTRAALGKGSAPLADANAATLDVAETGTGGLSRRGFLGTVAAASGVLTIATIGETVRPLAAISVLAPRDPRKGPQGLPVNRSAEAAGVVAAATSADYRLTVTGRGVAADLVLTADEVRAMATHRATLPIQCVEGWSAAGHWQGVRVRDLVARAGAPTGRPVRVESIEHGTYGTSVLNRLQAADPDTMLATHLRGEPLHIEHGAPVRLIAPNRPGVEQTKWVTRVVVL